MKLCFVLVFASFHETLGIPVDETHSLFNDPSRFAKEGYGYFASSTDEERYEDKKVFNKPLQQLSKESSIRKTVKKNYINEKADVAFLYVNNPCLARSCYHGAMCVVLETANSTADAFNRTECVCPTSCADDVVPICATSGETFPNKCFLHKEACKGKRNIDVAYEGTCFAKTGHCGSRELSDFVPRFTEWMMFVREEYLYGETHMNRNIIDVADVEKTHIVEWMFKYLDANRDDVIDKTEISELLYYMLSMEHCIEEFVKECDSDHDGYIFFNEWKLSLLSGSNSVEDTFFDGV